MNLTRAAISRPIFIFMLMIGAFLLGYMAYKSMKVESTPEVNFGVVDVATEYPGASPDEVNTLVSRKIEEAVSGVSGLREVTSTSQEGISSVIATFEVGVDMDVALNDMRAKVDAITNQLPTEVLKPTITKFDTSSIPILYYVIKSSKLSNEQLRDLADDKLKDQFARIDGVAEVNVSGGDVREIQIRVKKNALLAYGVGIDDIQRAVAAATLNVPSGRMVTGGSELAVRVLGEFKTVPEMRRMTLNITDPTNPMAKGRLVRLSDVADVQDSVVERRLYNRLDSKDAVLLVIQKSRDGNEIEIADAAKGVVKDIQTEYKDDGITFSTINDDSTRIKAAIDDLNFSLVLGICLVGLIVYIFLHNFRGTMIVALAIPTSIFATFIGMKLLGFTINQLSMLCLSLAVGVLVDDAIVVIENIYRHLKLGEEPREAALNGRGEIGLAAIAITMVDVVVFLPIGTMGGLVGQFFRPLGLGFVIAVLFSLFVSFTLTPMLASRWYRAGEDVESQGGAFAHGFERGFGALTRFYGRCLEWSLNHRWTVFIAGFTVLGAIFMTIAGSMMSSARDAFQTMATFVSGFVIALAFTVFGINYWPKVMGLHARRTVMLVGSIVGVVAMFAVRLPAPAALFGGLALPWVLYGVAAFIANFAYPRFRFRFLVNALLLALIFPCASWFGYVWKNDLKGDDIFKFQFMPDSDNGTVTVQVQLPPGSSIAATERVIAKIESIVKKDPDAEYVLSTIGAQQAGVFSAGVTGANYGSVQVTLYDKAAPVDDLMFWKRSTEHLRRRSDQSVAADILQAIGRIPEADVYVSATSSMSMGQPIQVSFRSDDRDKMVELASEIKRRLKAGAVPGLINADISSKPGTPEIRAIPDRTKLADVGLSVAQIANAMRILYEGNNDTKYRVNGREYDIRVMMDRVDRDNPRIVDEVPVSFVQGNPVFLNQVATLQPGYALDKIDRRDRIEEVLLTADLLPGKAAGTVQNQLNTFLDQYKDRLAAAGITTKALGQADFMKREGPYLFTAFGIGLLLVYMLLASLYDNLLYPFIIQLAQPQAMIGALLALMLTDKNLNIVGFVGIITLVGLVGKNAILLVDYTNTLRSRGRTRHDALVEAGPTRLRPIMMTTLALILAMMPIALSLGRGSEFRNTIGITILGGMMLSTLLTLLVIPCSYTIMDDMSLFFGRLMHHEPVSTLVLEPEAAESAAEDKELIP
jgi:HAE1 family hydrophobic/amphiphilic exporter-1